jgi:hypothetical protein
MHDDSAVTKNAAWNMRDPDMVVAPVQINGRVV